MIRFVPLAIMVTGLLLVWFLNPPWSLLVVMGIIAALIAFRIFVNPKNYE
ncbi:MAG: hypothetical protein Q7S83_01905 [bacterium]|nr:hypothetical protein [bacterium]